MMFIVSKMKISNGQRNQNCEGDDEDRRWKQQQQQQQQHTTDLLVPTSSSTVPSAEVEEQSWISFISLRKSSSMELNYRKQQRGMQCTINKLLQKTLTVRHQQ